MVTSNANVWKSGLDRHIDIEIVSGGSFSPDLMSFVLLRSLASHESIASVSSRNDSMSRPSRIQTTPSRVNVVTSDSVSRLATMGNSLSGSSADEFHRFVGPDDYNLVPDGNAPDAFDHCTDRHEGVVISIDLAQDIEIFFDSRLCPCD